MFLFRNAFTVPEEALILLPAKAQETPQAQDNNVLINFAFTKIDFTSIKY